MKNLFVIVLMIALLTEMDTSIFDDGYPVKNGCRISCIPSEHDDLCDQFCKKKKAKSDGCDFDADACYCWGELDEMEIWEPKTSKCNSWNDNLITKILEN
uniref:Venom toxin-like peptide n=1 Tax=Mesobuthus eupeus TaxID=34648 RepID=E4VP06_MESEU|nr:venom toxin-like peptide [Mesobuthus eupeus]